MLDLNTALVMVNAVYFKGAWLMQFDPRSTAEALFYTSSGAKPVQMMKAKKKFLVGSAYKLGARMLQLPYKVRRMPAPSVAPSSWSNEFSSILSSDMLHGKNIDSQ